MIGSSAGFRLSNCNLPSPDVSFVPAAKMPLSPRAFAEMVPDLTLKVRSASDNIKPLAEKLQRFIELGSQLGILVDSKNLTLTVYRASEEPIVLTNEDTLTIPEFLPGRCRDVT